MNILELIAGIVLALGTLLPCYTVSFLGISKSLSYIQGDGIFVMIAAVIIVVLTVLKKEKFAAIPAGISLILLIYFTSEASQYSGLGDFGIGLYLMWIGAIASIVLPFVKIKK